MEESNVNNLNGVPNFGHGYDKGSQENPFTRDEAVDLMGEEEVQKFETEALEATEEVDTPEEITSEETE